MKRCTIIELIGIDYKLRYPPSIFKFPSVFVPDLSFSSPVLRFFWGLIEIYYWRIGSLETTQGTGQKSLSQISLRLCAPSFICPSCFTLLLRAYRNLLPTYWKFGDNTGNGPEIFKPNFPPSLYPVFHLPLLFYATSEGLSKFITDVLEVWRQHRERARNF